MEKNALEVEEGTLVNGEELKTEKKRRKKRRRSKSRLQKSIRETYTLAESVRIHRSLCGGGSEIWHINFGNRNGW
jgi:hypothetical protein